MSTDGGHHRCAQLGFLGVICMLHENGAYTMGLCQHEGVTPVVLAMQCNHLHKTAGCSMSAGSFILASAVKHGQKQQK